MSQIIEITDLSLPALENQLRNRLEPQKGIFIAESLKVIRSALAAGCRPVSFLMERKHLEGQAKSLLEAWPQIPVYTGQREVLSALTGYALTRGILCAIERPTLPPVNSVCKDARRIAILEGVVDATNIGAIFRSAAALNMDGILLTSTCCARSACKHGHGFSDSVDIYFR